jgi:hypothetical protein
MSSFYRYGPREVVYRYIPVGYVCQKRLSAKLAAKWFVRADLSIIANVRATHIYYYVCVCAAAESQPIRSAPAFLNGKTKPV